MGLFDNFWFTAGTIAFVFAAFAAIGNWYRFIFAEVPRERYFYQWNATAYTLATLVFLVLLFFYAANLL